MVVYFTIPLPESDRYRDDKLELINKQLPQWRETWKLDEEGFKWNANADFFFCIHLHSFFMQKVRIGW